MDRPSGEKELEVSDLLQLGYGADMAKRIVDLLEDGLLLDRYLQRGGSWDCVPLTRITPGYPEAVRKRLGPDAPGCLWYLGQRSLLDRPGIALVGSRALKPTNRQFAMEVGRQAARQGFVLVSGNAVGADETAQNACLEAGGYVIAVVADELKRHGRKGRVLFLAEDGYDQVFSPYRALSRNRIIHALGQVTVVAQVAPGQGGTWDGCMRNLRFGYSPVFCFDDGSDGAKRLEQMGATLIGPGDLKDLTALRPDNRSLFDR